MTEAIHLSQLITIPAAATVPSLMVVKGRIDTPKEEEEEEETVDLHSRGGHNYPEIMVGMC